MTKKYSHIYYQKKQIWVNNHTSIGDLIGDSEPRINNTYVEAEDLVFRDQIVAQFNDQPEKQKVVSYLMEGFNFNQIRRMLDIKHSQIYKIKKELQEELKFLTKPNVDHAKVLEENPKLMSFFLQYVQSTVAEMSLKRFNDVHIYDYDPEASTNGWHGTLFQNTLEEIWETNQKSCTLAPREHLKTHTVLSYLIKKIFLRKFPLEIDYYHLNQKMAKAKIRKFKQIVRRNPILADNFELDDAKSDSEDMLILKDGTIISPLAYTMGVVGKHPHIIVLDDIIDRQVIYSNDRNQKAIDKFFMDIYPMISHDDPERKIIMIGTSQRDDDLYHSLPEDVPLNIYKAVIDDETEQILSPDLFTYEQLMRIKARVTKKHGEKYWLKEYQNETYNAMELIIKAKDIRYHSDMPENLTHLARTQGYDLSTGKDPDNDKLDDTAWCTLDIYKDDEDNLHFKIITIDKAKLDFEGRVANIGIQARVDKPNAIAIESNIFQYDTVQTAQKKLPYNIFGVKSISNKIESFRVELAPHFEAHRVYLPDDSDDFVRELLSLPIGDHDDRSDALKIAVKAYQHKPEEPNIRFLDD